MSFSQLRVALVIAVGVVGASLLGATFVGCQTSPTYQGAANGAYGQYNRGPNGQPAATAGMPPGDLNNLAPQNRQAFLSETQRIGAQQQLTLPDVVAMKRSGQSDQQIAMAIQARGAGLNANPNAAQYLSQNGINPAVLNAAGQLSGMNPGMAPGMTAGMPGGMPVGAPVAMPGSMPMQMAGGPPVGMPMSQYPVNGGSPAYQPMNNGGSTPINTVFNNSPSAAAAPTAPDQASAVQPAGYETSAQPTFNSAAPAAAMGGTTVPGQSWRPMGH